MYQIKIQFKYLKIMTTTFRQPLTKLYSKQKHPSLAITHRIRYQLLTSVDTNRFWTFQQQFLNTRNLHIQRPALQMFRCLKRFFCKCAYNTCAYAPKVNARLYITQEHTVTKQSNKQTHTKNHRRLTHSTSTHITRRQSNFALGRVSTEQRFTIKIWTNYLKHPTSFT